MSRKTQLGIDRCLADPPPTLRGAKFGLLMNQASVDGRLRYTCDALAERFPDQLVSLLSPQHGLWCEEQDNMIETPHSIYAPLKVPLYSLYSETRKPTNAMLADLDCLLIDLQDVGTRVYTFVWTVTHCLEACAEADIPVLLLDRPNPLGGSVVEGPLLDPAFSSFVGLASLPMRHGLTLGELAAFVNKHLQIGASLSVVPMSGWERDMYWPETGLAWIPPSPNMPRFETAMVYPGQVLLEGTNLSEGRGTTSPFEVLGAPFINQDMLNDNLTQLGLPGLVPRPIRFRPAFNKWHDRSCGGIALSISDNFSEVRSYAATLAVMSAVRDLWPEDFKLNPPPYEYETKKLPMDILTGGNQVSSRLAAGPLTQSDISDLAEIDHAAWIEATSEFLLYPVSRRR
jgi:uncharacterized protein YbbC (DUF1343 family)